MFSAKFAANKVHSVIPHVPAFIGSELRKTEKGTLVILGPPGVISSPRKFCSFSKKKVGFWLVSAENEAYFDGKDLKHHKRPKTPNSAF